MASLVTLAELATPLGLPLKPTTSISDAICQLESEALFVGQGPEFRIALIKDDANILGWITLQDLLITEHNHLPPIVKNLEAHQLITADMTALDAANLVCTSEYKLFFTLDGNAIKGTFCYHNLFTPPFRLCLFALSLQLETVALDLILQAPEIMISNLNESRIEMAKRVFDRRNAKHGTQDAAGLLRCTTFVDKATMLIKSNVLSDVIKEHSSHNTLSKTHLREIFVRAERVRNFCAHPDSDDTAFVIMNPDKLMDFINNTSLLIHLINKQKEKHLP